MTIYTCRWGILSTGTMAQGFVKDLLMDPKPRGVHDVKHKVVAVGSSSGVSKSEEFLQSMGIQGAAAYGDYESLAVDPNVDVIYVATPHSHHYAHVLLALNAGKHVLNEKPFTINATQAKKLYQLATEKGLFLMDAVWTRFFPTTRKIVELLQNGEIGEVKRVLADFSFDVVTPDLPDSSRFLDPNLGGGSVLDLGLYTLTWIFLALYHTYPTTPRTPPTTIHAHSIPFAQTSNSPPINDITSMLIGWPDRVGIATLSITIPEIKVDGLYKKCFDTPQPIPAIRIQGTKGTIEVPFPPPRPANGFSIDGVEQKGFEVQDGVIGWCYEADEVARCLRDGKTRSEVINEEESVLIMECLDEVRKSAGIRYPESIEKV